VDPAIIVKFVRQETRESLYRSRKRLKSITMADFGFFVDKKIFINERVKVKNPIPPTHYRHVCRHTTDALVDTLPK